jgi:hypothetical protein
MQARAKEECCFLTQPPVRSRPSCGLTAVLSGYVVTQRLLWHKGSVAVELALALRLNALLCASL